MFGFFKKMSEFEIALANVEIAFQLIGLEIESSTELNNETGEKTFIMKHDGDQHVKIKLHVIDFDECMYCVNVKNEKTGDFTSHAAVYKLVDAIVTIMYEKGLAKLTAQK